jgi:putative oxidoreductase
MSDATALDIAMLVLRVGLGVVMLAHGINHVRNIEGTGKWFASMGMRPGRWNAWLATLTELGAGPLLIVGLLTPFAAAGVVGVGSIAWLIHHRRNGFFIFNPGEGYEYVMTMAAAAVALGTVGPGGWSLDRAIDIDDELLGTPGLLISGVGGIAGAALVAALFWRPATAP